MEITYDLIIKYLCNNPKLNNFITQKNIFTYATDFPIKFKNFLNDKFYRYGITVYNNENENISFWSSILTLIDPEFLIPYDNDELIMISAFKTQLLEKYKKSENDKNLIKENFKKPDTLVLQHLVNIININLIIFDFEKEEIYAVYDDEIMNPWKPSLLLAKHTEYWEPIMHLKNGEIQRLFDYNDIFFKKILCGDIIKQPFNYIINIADVVKFEKNKHKISDNENDNTDINNKYKSYTLSKLNKLKISDLSDIMIELKIDIIIKPKKAELVKLIADKLNIIN
jgi:hypothetical protein